MKKIALELCRWCFTIMTGFLLPVAFIVFCFQCSHAAIVEFASEVWVDD